MDQCKVVRNSDSYDGRQGLTYATGISRQSVGSQAICLHLLNIPTGGRANAHLHDNHESAIFMISGQAEQLWGNQLENHDVVNAGDYVYIPAGVPHVVMNLTDEPIVAVISRTDAIEQESVVLLPELEPLVESFLAQR